MLFSPMAAADWSKPGKVISGGWIGEASFVAGVPRGGAHVAWVDGNALRVRRVSSRGRLGRIATLARKTSDLAHWPVIASGRSGGLVAVWYVDVPDVGWSLRMRRMTAGGALGPVRVLADAADLSHDFESTRMGLATHADGSATVVWAAVRGHGVEPKGFAITGATVHARRIGARGRLGPMLDVADAGEMNPAPNVAAGPGGRATVVWQARTGAGTVVRTAAFDSDGVGPVQDLSTPSPHWSTDGPGVFTNARGVGLSIWGGSVSQDLVGHRMADGTAQGSPLVLAPPASSYWTTAVIDASGKATVAWRHVEPPEAGFVNQVRFRQLLADGTLGPLSALSAPHAEVSAPALAVDRTGAITTGWTTMEPADDGRYRYAVQVRQIAADGRPGAIRTLERSHEILRPPSVLSGRRGRAMAVWSEFGRKGALRVSRYVAGCSKAQLRRSDTRSRRRPPTRCR